jgi:uncharacterized Zn finger protein (UPF0148 family)
MQHECPECGHVLMKFNGYFVCKVCNIRYKLVKGKLTDYIGDY